MRFNDVEGTFSLDPGGPAARLLSLASELLQNAHLGGVEIQIGAGLKIHTPEYASLVTLMLYHRLANLAISLL